MKQAICRLLLMSTLLVSACNANTLTFEEFASEAGQFSIAAPSPMEETQQSVPTPVGPIDIYTFTAEEENSAYVVAYSDYPAEVVEQSDPESLLDSSRDGALGNLNGTLLSEDPIDIDGNPGRSLVIDAITETGEAATINSRIYLVNNRLYQILVVMPKGQEATADAATFLESFTLQ
ncbi:MAG: hypothetical protein F6J95_028600 [Leptolyngbya sp. SIO1E4]|nr:hypothetical protein [Leptolyngbya sp. SIO1E4]